MILAPEPPERKPPGRKILGRKPPALPKQEPPALPTRDALRAHCAHIFWCRFMRLISVFVMGTAVGLAEMRDGAMCAELAASLRKEGAATILARMVRHIDNIMSVGQGNLGNDVQTHWRRDRRNIVKPALALLDAMAVAESTTSTQ